MYAERQSSLAEIEQSGIPVQCSAQLCTKWIWLINALQQAFKLITVIVLDFLQHEFCQLTDLRVINRLNASVKDSSKMGKLVRQSLHQWLSAWIIFKKLFNSPVVILLVINREGILEKQVSFEKLP